MAAVVRVDRLSSDKVEWGSSEFEVTWVANDPLSPSTISGGETAGTRPVGKVAPDATASGSMAPPKDVRDFDAIFGVGGSWAAKSLRIFPEIHRMCKEQQTGDVSRIQMLAVTTDDRYAVIVNGDTARVLGSKAEGIRNMSVIGTMSLGHHIYSEMLAHI
ncbi:hypothetical protein FBU31_005659 [Coemansia sp. 'formosensis']|nr:hypothetical protein FBU31_005659 [Coemansia sp. 'formosensis']